MNYVCFLFLYLQFVYSYQSTNTHYVRRKISQVRIHSSKQLSKRFSPDHSTPKNRKLKFVDESFNEITYSKRHEPIVLKCSASGSPVPTISWFKDGERINQDIYNIQDAGASVENQLDPSDDKVQLSTTESRLYIDCPTKKSQGEYTCYADTGYSSISRTTFLRVRGNMKRRDLCFTSIVGNFTPAKIYMWTAVRLENEGSTVQLFCRANGWPVPKISWYKISTRGKLQSLLHSNFCQQYKVERNGDLIIRNGTFADNLGFYKCVAENKIDSRVYRDDVEVLFYPTAPEETLWVDKSERDSHYVN